MSKAQNVYDVYMIGVQCTLYDVLDNVHEKKAG
jgi:hypothetical protein